MPRDCQDELRSRIQELRSELSRAEAELQALDDAELDRSTPKELPLRLDEYRRYGRQMILPGFGLQGQVNLKNASILVVGAGGLGCPVLLYLAGAGVGNITVVDSDTVEASNLHRQVLHTQDRTGMSKAESAKIGMTKLNPRVNVTAICNRFTQALLTSSTIPLDRYTLVIDCTDNAPTRYLLSDACVRAAVTLVSGGAVGLEGWSGVWNLPSVPSPEGTSLRGPCLRCIYPQSKHDNSGNCEDEGVLGTVTGVIGTLMANEAIKLIVGMHELKPAMTLFSPLSTPMFRNLRLRGRKPDCPGCSGRIDNITTAEDTAEFCGVPEVESDRRVGPTELQSAMKSGRKIMVLDVRPEIEYTICALPGSTNISHTAILREPQRLLTSLGDSKEVYMVCRRGNDSLLDARLLSGQLPPGTDIVVKDLAGGLRGWSSVDPGFPVY